MDNLLVEESIGLPSEAESEALVEVDNLLENGILVETDDGVVCMPVNDALASELNLSTVELKRIAAKLLLQNKTETGPVKRNINSDSDGFSSECSDACGGPSKFSCPSNIGMPSQNQLTEFVEIASVLPSSTCCSEFSASSNVSDSDGTSVSLKGAGNEPVASEIKSSSEVHKPQKRRGGWPKGRKRKPELLNLPPKAPATGYNLYLNEQRKFFKESSLAFHEITKIIGNRWSSLSLEEKQPYLDKAEEDKKRYREELKAYRQSHAYRAYLAKKRQKRLQNNILSESDMDATDEIDEEDNEELYCRTCDQWFHNLHNKREHLQGKQHTQAIAGDIRRELQADSQCQVDTDTTAGGLSCTTSLDDSSLDGVPQLAGSSEEKSSSSVAESIANLIATVRKRDRKIKTLQNRLREAEMSFEALCKQLSLLNDRHNKLKNDLQNLKEQEEELQNNIFQLWKVPSLSLVNDLNDFNDCDIL